MLNDEKLKITQLNPPSVLKVTEESQYIEDKFKNNNKLILILIGLILCLLLIILNLLVVPFSSIEPELKKSLPIAEESLLKVESSLSTFYDDLPIVEDFAPIVIVEDSTPEFKDSSLSIINKTQLTELNTKKQLISFQEKDYLIKKFNQLLTDALLAIDNNKLVLANKKILLAKKIKPDDPVIKEISERIKILIREDKINKNITKAYQREKNEQWELALIKYNNILQIDSSIHPVILKKQRVLKYLSINQSLDKIIAKPARLQNKEILKQSKELFDEIKLIIKEKKLQLYSIEKTPKLRDKILTTEKIISEASTPVSVTILSDGLTDIRVYKIAHFGRINKKIINLRPGQYVIVGSRSGYRDQRKTINIKVNDQPVIIRIECREAI